MAVLKVNFKNHGNGAEKIEKGEFAIEDTITRRDIDLSADWELCFSPGKQVEMSILVIRIQGQNIICPKCYTSKFRVSILDGFNPNPYNTW